jgi:PAS domain S-box-containing protein
VPVPGKPRDQVNPVTRLRSLVRDTPAPTWFGAAVIFIAAGYIFTEEMVGTLFGEEAGLVHIALQVVMVGLLAAAVIGFGRQREAAARLLADSEREGNRLATAIDQAMDAVVITDVEGVITYVNPAFERVSGYSRAEALGRRPSVLKSGVQTDASYATLWRTITAGDPWRGEFVNRRKDGSLFREVASITPVRDGDGVIVNFVAVKRDVTRQRAVEDALNREIRERAAMIAALERVGSSGDPATIGAGVCEEVTHLPGIGLAAMYLFDGDQAMTLAYAGPADVPISAGRPLPPSRAEYLRSRADLGPWAELWRAREADGPYGERVAQAGVQAVAYAPLRDATGVFGVLAVGTLLASEANTLLDRLPAFGALAAVVSSRLAAAVRRDIAEDGVHRDFEDLIAARAFHPVFQPIVDLHTGEPVGYEALTRFDDGTSPDVQFGRAANVGLGVELEIVTLQAAVTAGRQLPAGTYITLNISPEAALRPDVLAATLAHVDRPVVLEITEHAVINDYAALRAVARSLPVPARLAVDDAGAGFASLRHVLELAPDIVKIDRTIVVGIDRDPARQALVAGLRYFAAKRGIQLIAEGIETARELDALTSLAIPLGQGYLLGRPVPVSEIDGATVHLPAPLAPRSIGRAAGPNSRTAGLGAAKGPSVLARTAATVPPRIVRRRQAQPPVNPPPLA